MPHRFPAGRALTGAASGLLVLSAFATPLLASGATATASAGRASAPVRVTHTEVLRNDVVPGLGKDTRLGAASAGERIQVTLTLNRPHAAAERSLVNAMYTPGNPAYHQFLTPARFDARFGVAAATFDAVRSWVLRDGLTAVWSAGSRDVLALSGTVAQAERTFHVAIDRYRTAAGKRFYANTAGPTVPAGMSVEGLFGLNNLLAMHRGPIGPSRAVLKTPGARTNQSECEGSTCIGLTTPQDLWSVYDQPGGYRGNPNGNLKVDYGQGQQMAIFGEGQTGPVVDNLREFESLNKLPRVPVTVVRVDGPKANYSDNSGEGEWDLDSQASTGMSPDVSRLVFYFGTSLSDADVENMFAHWADDPNGPLQANASFGECEENPVGNALASTPAAYSAGEAFTIATEAALEKAVLEGRTLFSSAGDTGSTCPVVPVNLNGVAYQVPGVNYPASSPYVVAVGGTVLYTTSKTPPTRSEEYAWTYGGGGTSDIFPEPKWQKAISAVNGECLSTDKGGTATPGTTCRGVPDVAAQSGDIVSNGYGIEASGQTDYPGAGTSLSSPLWMGMWTRIQAAAYGHRNCKANGAVSFPGNGFAAPALYAAYAKDASKDFFDIGGGTSSPPTVNGEYHSGPGWDYLSGMGAPDVTNLIKDIDRNSTLAPADPVLPVPGAAPNATRPNDCTALFTSPPGSDSYPLGLESGNNPQLDILAGNMNTVTVKGSKDLETVMVINDLSTAAANPAGGGNEYYFLWTYGGKEYFSVAQVNNQTGAVTYNDGYVNGNTFQNVNTDTGQFITGKDGKVIVYVPLKNVGNPPTGTTLLAPSAQTRVLVGTTATGGFIETADAADPYYNYVVGQRCTDKYGIAPGPYGSYSVPYTLSYAGAGKLPKPQKKGSPVLANPPTCSRRTTRKR
jgi:hypothetical protein